MTPIVPAWKVCGLEGNLFFFFCATEGRAMCGDVVMGAEQEEHLSRKRTWRTKRRLHWMHPVPASCPCILSLPLSLCSRQCSALFLFLVLSRRTNKQSCCSPLLPLHCIPLPFSGSFTHSPFIFTRLNPVLLMHASSALSLLGPPVPVHRD